MDIVVGMGQIGKPWFDIISKSVETIGVDLEPERCRGRWKNESVDRLHMCIPWGAKFEFFHETMDRAEQFKPRALIIHSTIKPGTTEVLDSALRHQMQVVYSPVRGVHGRMDLDMRRYDKFYAGYGMCDIYEELMTKAVVLGYKMSNPLTLEYAKILCDTSYYGFLIAWAMKTEEIAMKNGLNYDEMWMFAHQIHKMLDNRPPCGAPGMNKIYPDPKGIGGHCVMQNLELVKGDLGDFYDVIQKANSDCIERHSSKPKLSREEYGGEPF